MDWLSSYLELYFRLKKVTQRVIFSNLMSQNKILKLISVETRISTNFRSETICQVGRRQEAAFTCHYKSYS
ncbi:protein of unknown function [Candidatus Nitrosotalea okcheonensis]|uniref:Uncharacterized protein n=1 Tax=Candidatus Nitrosotalea okcheonensis TaxID=1903276 RepID=A0A2H1FGC7_9ARCH|nr:protein of unknown function [Candidatus Nitrosotalea okcheonensis]